MSRVRCAIYTRKSSDEGLDQAFNSLDAQREACEAYIKSQSHAGWQALATQYDDGGASGGNMDRSAFQQLLTDVDEGRIDMIVVYKIDRLTRSLSDFAKLVDRLDAAEASFVSVTQQFNTSTSMGRLTLNMLLSFAQFEREVTAERIRDKIAASKKKGIWMGGLVPLGYDKAEEGLKVCEPEAATVRILYQAYLDLGCVRKLKSFADREGMRSKTRTLRSGKVIEGKPFSRGALYHLLRNPIYIGKIPHKEELYDGLHDRIISDTLWDKVQAKLASNAVARKAGRNARSRSPLAGKVFDADGRPLTPTHASKSGKRYRYYVSRRSGDRSSANWRISAQELEHAVFLAMGNDTELRHRFARAGQSDPDTADLAELIERVQIHETYLRIETCRAPDAQPHTIEAPYTMRRRGVEAKMVLNAHENRTKDVVLMRRILRAMEWVSKIKSRRSISDIAGAEPVTPEYITHNMDLAYLSPKILTAILEGKQRPDVSAYQLSKVQIPANWCDQDSFFLP